MPTTYEQLERDYNAARRRIYTLENACRAAMRLAWEVGSETEDGVHTLLEDSRGDLYRQLSAALETDTKPQASNETKP